MAVVIRFSLPQKAYVDDATVGVVEALFKQAGFDVGGFTKIEDQGRLWHHAAFSKSEGSEFEFSAVARMVNATPQIEIVEASQDASRSPHLRAVFRIPQDSDVHVVGDIEIRGSYLEAEIKGSATLSQFIRDIGQHPASYIRARMRQKVMYQL